MYPIFLCPRCLALLSSSSQNYRAEANICKLYSWAQIQLRKLKLWLLEVELKNISVQEISIQLFLMLNWDINVENHIFGTRGCVVLFFWTPIFCLRLVLLGGL